MADKNPRSGLNSRRDKWNFLAKEVVKLIPRIHLFLLQRGTGGGDVRRDRDEECAPRLLRAPLPSSDRGEPCLEFFHFFFHSMGIGKGEYPWQVIVDL